MPHIALKKASATWPKHRHKIVIIPFAGLRELVYYIYIQLRMLSRNYLWKYSIIIHIHHENILWV